MNSKELGAYGESRAAEFLVSKGFIEISRNLHFKMGEIDLLMWDGSTVVVVEVKTVRSAVLIDPIYKIGPAKQKKLRRLATLVSVRYPERNVRVDAVTVYWKPGVKSPITNHYENILQ